MFSVSPTDLSSNKYYYTFFQVDSSNPTVLKSYTYNNDMTTVNTLDVSFGSQNIVDILTLLDQSGANPYVIGTTHDGTQKVNMDLGHFCVYKKALSTADHSELMTTVNTSVSEVFTDATIYKVTASGGKFYIDGVENPSLSYENGKYVFDQSDSSNTGHPLRFSETENGTGGEYITRVFKNGTPGSLNAYTFINATSGVPSLYYYCTNHLGMGNTFIALIVAEQVKVVQNILGESVFAIGDPLTDTVYNQPDLSFNTGDRVTYNLSHSSMSGHNVVFGTEVDNSSTIISSSYVTVTGTPGSEDATLTLDLTGYSGDAVYYFEDTSANMGYTGYSTEAAQVVEDIETDLYTHFTFDNINGTTLYNETSNGNATLKNITQSSTVTKKGTHSIYATLTATHVASGIYGSFLPSSMYSSDFTLCFWHYITATSGNSMLMRDLGRGYYIRMSNNVLQYNKGSMFDIATLSNNTWYHIAICHNDTANTLAFYIDGVLQSTLTSGQFDTGTQSSNFCLCGTKNGSSFGAGIVGYMDDFRFYTRILTVNQLLYFLESASAPPPTVHQVTVSGSPSVFYLDGVATPDISLNSGETYIFDQSDSSNDGNQLVFGTVPELTSNIVGTTDGVTIVGTPGQPGAYTQFTVSGDYGSSNSEPVASDPEWVLVFRQHNGYYWSVDPETNALNESDSTNNNYSVLNNIDNYKDADGKFHFKYQSYNLGNKETTSNTQEWKQNLGPFAGTHPVSNSGYTAISLESTGSISFAGLFKSSSSNTYLDCTSGGDWWYPVAATRIWSNGRFPTIYGTIDGRNTIEVWAYTSYGLSSSSSSSSSSRLYYYSFSTQNMGQVAVDTHYYVKAVQNIVGDTVFAISTTENGTYYNQMDLSFNAGDKALFHTSDSSMDGYNLTFGTEVDDISTVVDSSYVIVSDTGVLLDLTDYTGDAVYYFEDTSSNMGYNTYESTSITAPLLTESYEISTIGHVLHKNTGSSPVAFSTRQTAGSPTTIYIKFKTNASVTSSSNSPNLLISKNIHPTQNFVRSYNPFYIAYYTHQNKIFIYPGIHNYYGIHSYTSNELEFDTVYHLFVKLNTYNNTSPDEFDISLYNDSNTTIITGTITYTSKINADKDEITVASGYSRDSNSPTAANVVSQDDLLNVYFMNVYDKYTTTSDDQSLITYTNSVYTSVVSMENFTPVSDPGQEGGYDVSYSITVSGSPSVFYLDGVATPDINLNAGDTYIFDQSDSSNDGHQVVFGYTKDDTSDILDNEDGVNVVGTPGLTGAYTRLVLPSNFTGTLYYYCFYHSNMGN